MAGKINIKVVNLNNKSRKGEYVYIKENKKPSRYYKLDRNFPADVYVQYYKDSIYNNRKKKGSLKEYQEVYSGQKTRNKSLKRKVQKEKLKKIEETIKSGIGTGRIRNVLNTNNVEIHNAKKNALKNLVSSQDVLDVLAKNENFKKFKTKIENRITIKDTKGNTIGSFTAFNKIPEQVIQELKKAFHKKEEVTEDSPSNFKNKLNFYNFKQIDIKQDGYLSNFDMEIIFRKG